MNYDFTCLKDLKNTYLKDALYRDSSLLEYMNFMKNLEKEKVTH